MLKKDHLRRRHTSGNVGSFVFISKDKLISSLSYKECQHISIISHRFFQNSLIDSGTCAHRLPLLRVLTAHGQTQSGAAPSHGATASDFSQLHARLVCTLAKFPEQIFDETFSRRKSVKSPDGAFHLKNTILTYLKIKIITHSKIYAWLIECLGLPSLFTLNTLQTWRQRKPKPTANSQRGSAFHSLN